MSFSAFIPSSSKITASITINTQNPYAHIRLRSCFSCPSVLLWICICGPDLLLYSCPGPEPSQPSLKATQLGLRRDDRFWGRSNHHVNTQTTLGNAVPDRLEEWFRRRSSSTLDTPAACRGKTSARCGCWRQIASFRMG